MSNFTPLTVGLNRGRLLIKQDLSSPSIVIGALVPTLMTAVVLFFLRDVGIDGGAGIGVGAAGLAGVIGMNVAFSGFMGLTGTLLTERTDGTMLRAKSVPGGMTSYVVGLCVNNAAFCVISIVVLIIPGLTVFDGITLNTVDSWVTLIWVTALGLAATMPMGLMLGSLISNPRNMGLIMLPLMGIIAISGVFYPITAMPTWVQGIGQAFPIYWLGLGMRSATLPETFAAVEIGGTWRTFETIGVLGIWVVIGFIAAPAILRRMARKESGSSVAARRQQMMKGI